MYSLTATPQYMTTVAVSHFLANNMTLRIT
jgi:hypothetical protein